MVNVFAMVKSRFGACRRRSKTPERSSTAERTTVPIHTPTQEVARMHRKAVFQEDIINQEDEELTYECGMTSINQTPVRFFQISCVRNIRRARRRSDEGAVSVLIDSCM